MLSNRDLKEEMFFCAFRDFLMRSSPRISAAAPNFFCCRPIMASSIESLMMRRFTITGFVWPIRWARAIACVSLVPFQSTPFM
ncbi:hypothetical protein MT325_m273R [Paramecium bursaria chlorella virus MT325]|uniref:Uncharacterized protein m273R n=1 Tax=Paramecium bursaria Chlorella virus MT325 TaxID=346932 RepID=A7IU03_PBCVM|nr:hypothetical protein MT325_m273R [Paramecium bursaria chlorella virus MT325]